MVAETVEEVAVIPEVPEPAPVETPSPEPDPVEAYLQAEGLVESESPETPSETPEASDPAPEVRALAERIASEKLTEQQRTAAEAGLLMSFRQVAPQVRQVMNEIMQGQRQMTPEVTEWMVGKLQQLQGNAKQIYTQEAMDVWKKNTNAEIDKLFPKFSEGKYASTAEVIQSLVGKAREGYQSPKDVEKAIKQARIEEHKRLTENPAVLRSLLSRAEAPKNEAGSVPPPDAGLGNPESSFEQRQAAFQRKYGFLP